MHELRERPRVLVLSEVAPKRYSTLLDALQEDCDLDLRLYGENGIQDVLVNLDVQEYDRVLFASGVRRAGSQFFALRHVPELHVFDLDLQQDYMPESNYYNLFPAVFKQFRKLRLLVTSLAAQNHYSNLGFATSYIPKAYDHRLIVNLGEQRSTDFGFVGRTKNKIYKKRNDLLSRISEVLPVSVLRTADASGSSNEYNQVLNRIKYFISADAGFCEFHIKNFEAMAAGCVVCALHTSDEEAQLLGFRDLENIILYRSVKDLLQKIEFVEADSGRWHDMSQQAEKLALEQHQWRHRKPLLLEALQAECEAPPPYSMKDKARYAYLRTYLTLSRR